MRRRRVQQHVSFLRADGIELVLRMLENELNELKQLEQHSNARDESRASKGSKDRGSTEDKVKGLREGVGEERQGERRG